MIISLTISYSDLQAFITYSNGLISDLNSDASTATQANIKAMNKAYLSEILKCHNKLNTKLMAWPFLNKHNRLRRINFTYIQAYVYWIFYDVHTHPIVINDKISYMSKQLIH